MLREGRGGSYKKDMREGSARFMRVLLAVAVLLAPFSPLLTTSAAGATAGYAAQLVSKSAPDMINSGDTVILTVTFRNSGSKSWPASSTRIGTAFPYDRESAFYESSWLWSNRPVQTSSVTPPGGTASFSFPVKANVASGQFIESFSLVIEDVTWIINGGGVGWNVRVAGTGAYLDLGRGNQSKSGNLTLGGLTVLGLADLQGALNVRGDLSVGGKLTANTLISKVTSAPPLIVSSSVLVPNLYADRSKTADVAASAGSASRADDFTVAGNLSVAGNSALASLTATSATLNGNFLQNGAATFNTGTGAVSLNGDVTVAGGKTFNVTGATSLANVTAGVISATGLTISGDSVATLTAAQTLTNKTLTGPVLNNPTGNVVTGFSKTGSPVLTGPVSLTAGTNVSLSQAGNVITINSSAGGTVYNSGSALPQEPGLNFANGLKATDNPGAGTTDVTIDPTIVAKLAGAQTLDSKTFTNAGNISQAGSATFTTGSGAVMLNGPTTIAGLSSVGVVHTNGVGLLSTSLITGSDLSGAISITTSGAIVTTNTLSVGTNPAASGVIRIPNAGQIVARNGANTGDIPVVHVSAGDAVVVAPGGAASVTFDATTSGVYPSNDNSVALGGAGNRWSNIFSNVATLGTGAATTGTVRLPNATGIYSRNAAGTADFSLISSNAANDVVIQGVGGSGLTLINSAAKLAGGLTFNTDNSSDIGAAVSGRPRNLYLGNTAVIGNGLTVTSGNIGVGGPPGANAGVYVTALLNGSTQQYGYFTDATIGSGATSDAAGLRVGMLTQAAAFTLPSFTGVRVDNLIKGAGSSVTDTYGLYVYGQNAGSNSNYGLYVEAPGGGAANNVGIMNLGTTRLGGNLGFINDNATDIGTSALRAAHVYTGPGSVANPALAISNNGLSGLFSPGSDVGGPILAVSAQNAEQLRFNSNGAVFNVPQRVSLDSAYDIGASAAGRPRDVFIGRDITAGSHFSLGSTATDFYAEGASPALTGNIRLSSQHQINSRNAAGTADIQLLASTALDYVLIGGANAAGVITTAPSFAVGTNPAVTGAIRIPNNLSITSRNAGNTGDILLALVAPDNTIRLGGSGYFITDPVGGWTSFGAAPATAGVIRIPNGQGVATRNAANSGNYTVIQSNASDGVDIGSAGTLVNIPSGGLTLGAIPATTGNIRLPTASSIQYRNAANTANYDALSIDNADNIYVGSVATGKSVFLGTSTSVVAVNAGAQFVLNQGGGGNNYLTSANMANPPLDVYTAGIKRATWAYTSSTLDLLTTTTNIGSNTANYLSIQAANTGSTPTIYPSGSDANVGINIVPKGGGTVNLGNYVNLSYNFADSVQVQGGTGNVNFAATGTSANVGLTLTPKGTGIVSVVNALAVGATPATTGAIRVPNGGAIYGRNAANTADYALVGIRANNNIHVGNGAGSDLTVYSDGGSISVGATPATTGVVRIPTQQFIQARNAANTTNISIIGTDSSDRVYIDNGQVGTFIGGTAIVNGAFLSIGSIPATTGALRLPQSGEIHFRNNANTADLIALRNNPVDTLELGGFGYSSTVLNTPLAINGNLDVNGNYPKVNLMSTVANVAARNWGMMAYVQTLGDFAIMNSAAQGGSPNTVRLYIDPSNSYYSLGQSLQVAVAGRFLDTTTGGYLSSTGVWTNNSRGEAKEEIADIAADHTIALLKAVTVKTYRYRVNSHNNDNRTRVGVIAEELPDELAAADHKGAPTGELIALALSASRLLLDRVEKLEDLTKKQQQLIDSLTKRVDSLEKNAAPSPSTAPKAPTPSASPTAAPTTAPVAPASATPAPTTAPVVAPTATPTPAPTVAPVVPASATPTPTVAPVRTTAPSATPAAIPTR